MNIINLKWGVYKDTGTTSITLCSKDKSFPITANFQGIQQMLDEGEIAFWVEKNFFTEHKTIIDKLFSSGFIKDTGHRINIDNRLIKKCKVLKNITKVA